MSEAKEIIIGMADFKTGRAPDHLTTILGSCVGVCLYSEAKKIGGLLHLMMPLAGNSVNLAGFKKAKFADTGIPELVYSLKTQGVAPQDLVAKIFGGAKVLANVTRNVGEENAQTVTTILNEFGIPIKVKKVGGIKGYRIKFDITTGKVICQIFGGAAEEC